MGDGGEYRCPKCGYRFVANLGVGFMFPSVYAKIVAKMKKGELGEEAKQFFMDHPDGAVNAENVLAVCEECGSYEVVPELSLYIPKTGYVHKRHGREDLDEEMARIIDYVTQWELEEHYDKIGQLEQRCRSCDGKLKILGGETYDCQDLTCPCCGETMVMDGIMFWD